MGTDKVPGVLFSGTLWAVLVLSLTSLVQFIEPCVLCSEKVPNPGEICCRVGLGEKCGRLVHCDRWLTCRYPRRGAAQGVCKGRTHNDIKVPTGKGCFVDGQTFRHGEKFSLDCRTQCVCHNGTYACASRCPQENISPTGACHRPRLVELPGQCCREWLCDAPPVAPPPRCVERSEPWSDCPSCGGGTSRRNTNANSSCRDRQEVRLCQNNECATPNNSISSHNMRRGHSCKATTRLGVSRLRVGPCTSRRRYHPRLCGSCVQPGKCCVPKRTTTLKVEMMCPFFPIDEENEDINEALIPFIKPNENLWVSEDYIKEEKFKIIEKPFFKYLSGKKNHKKSWSHIFEKLSEKSVHMVNMEWVIKCHCDFKYCTTNSTSTKTVKKSHHSKNKAVLLHRVHRTAEP